MAPISINQDHPPNGLVYYSLPNYCCANSGILKQDLNHPDCVVRSCWPNYPGPSSRQRCLEIVQLGPVPGWTAVTS